MKPLHDPWSRMCQNVTIVSSITAVMKKHILCALRSMPQSQTIVWPSTQRNHKRAQASIAPATSSITMSFPSYATRLKNQCETTSIKVMMMHESSRLYPFVVWYAKMQAASNRLKRAQRSQVCELQSESTAANRPRTPIPTMTITKIAILSDSVGVIEMKKAALTGLLRQKQAAITSTMKDIRKYSRNQWVDAEWLWCAA